MDLNLTGELWGMPISFIGQMTQDSSTKITDWLPLVIVLIGGAVTYIVTFRLEHNRFQYELKAKTYFEATDILAKVLAKNSVDFLLSALQDKDREYGDTVNEDKANNIEKKMREFQTMVTELFAYDMRIKVIGSNETAQIFENIVNKLNKLASCKTENEFSEVVAFLDKEEIDLLNSMKKNLHIDPKEKIPYPSQN